jgi:RNA 3'-terminal phosphate cyclase (ATP)
VSPHTWTSRAFSDRVAYRVTAQVQDYLALQLPVGPYVADRLLVPMALAGGGRFRTVPPSRHTLTKMMAVFKLLIDIACKIRSTGRDQWETAIF